MKSLIVLAALMAAGSMASADIAAPSKIQTQTITGRAAKALYDSIAADEVPGDVLQTQSTLFKVDRPDDLHQTVCEKATQLIPKKPSVYQCTIQKSLDGQAIPEFIVPVRMG